MTFPKIEAAQSPYNRTLCQPSPPSYNTDMLCCIYKSRVSWKKSPDAVIHTWSSVGDSRNLFTFSSIEVLHLWCVCVCASSCVSR